MYLYTYKKINKLGTSAVDSGIFLFIIFIKTDIHEYNISAIILWFLVKRNVKCKNTDIFTFVFLHVSILLTLSSIIELLMFVVEAQERLCEFLELQQQALTAE
jgi:hypothetical protein